MVPVSGRRNTQLCKNTEERRRGEVKISNQWKWGKVACAGREAVAEDGSFSVMTTNNPLASPGRKSGDVLDFAPDIVRDNGVIGPVYFTVLLSPTHRSCPGALQLYETQDLKLV